MFERKEEYFEPVYTTSLQKHVVRTFAWMALGVLVTAVVSMAIYTLDLAPVLLSGYFPLVLIIAQFGVVIALATRLMKMSAASTKLLFLAYAVLTGFTVSVVAMAYLPGVIALAFLITAVYFGSLVIIGYTTKINLLSFGPILFIGLFALIITEVVMYFLGVDSNTGLFAAIGLVLFTAITAYDTQKMKVLYNQYSSDETMLSKLSIYSAFSLYLDFINIFLYILRFLGRRN